MASLSLPSLRSDMLLRPMPPAQLLAVATLVLVAGAAYCMGYEGLLGGTEAWPSSLVWSAYGVLPWLFVFEYVKRREWEADAPLATATIALLLVATGAFSIAVEILLRWLSGDQSVPVGLQLMRRLPAIAATFLLLLLARREQRAALAREHPAAGATEVEALRRQAPAIRWIQAADNYLELHVDGQVWTRRITMREAASVLEPLGFVRIHRSFIVNRSHVDAVVRDKGGPAVRTIDGALLPAGRAFSGNLRGLH